MKTAVLFDSQFGNTEHIAQAIATELRPLGEVQLVNIRTTSFVFTADVELLVVGGPTQMHHLSPPLRAQLDKLPPHSLDNVQVATFDTRARGPSLLTGAASRGIARLLERRGAQLVTRPESFLVSGTQGPLVDGELERATTWARQLVTIVQHQQPVLTTS